MPKAYCFAFRPQPALPRKLDSVNLVPRGYFRLYKRPRGIRQKKDWAEMDQVFLTLPFARSSQRLRSVIRKLQVAE